MILTKASNLSQKLFRSVAGKTYYEVPKFLFLAIQPKLRKNSWSTNQATTLRSWISQVAWWNVRDSYNLPLCGFPPKPPFFLLKCKMDGICENQPHVKHILQDSRPHTLVEWLVSPLSVWLNECNALFSFCICYISICHPFLLHLGWSLNDETQKLRLHCPLHFATC